MKFLRYCINYSTKITKPWPRAQIIHVAVRVGIDPCGVDVFPLLFHPCTVGIERQSQGCNKEFHQHHGIIHDMSETQSLREQWQSGLYETFKWFRTSQLHVLLLSTLRLRLSCVEEKDSSPICRAYSNSPGLKDFLGTLEALTKNANKFRYTKQRY